MNIEYPRNIFGELKEQAINSASNLLARIDDLIETLSFRDDADSHILLENARMHRVQLVGLEKKIASIKTPEKMREHIQEIKILATQISSIDNEDEDGSY